MTIMFRNPSARSQCRKPWPSLPNPTSTWQSARLSLRNWSWRFFSGSAFLAASSICTQPSASIIRTHWRAACFCLSCREGSRNYTMSCLLKLTSPRLMNPNTPFGNNAGTTVSASTTLRSPYCSIAKTARASAGGSKTVGQSRSMPREELHDVVFDPQRSE